jgi:two-component system, OmpR family, response regulator
MLLVANTPVRAMPAAEQATALLVEDDEAFAEELQEFLAAHGIRTNHVGTLDGIVGEVVRQRPGLLVLDQFVVGQDCITYLPQLRASYTGGIVILTGNRDEADRIVALETGADDFVAKSLGSRELLARLRALLRRTQICREAPAPGARGDAMEGTWLVDEPYQEIQAPDGSRVHLTPTEFEALRFLTGRSGRLVTRDEISEAILSRPFTPLDRSVDNIMSRLRRAFEPYVPGGAVIRSVRGRGYIYQGPEFAAVESVAGGTSVETESGKN